MNKREYKNLLEKSAFDGTFPSYNRGDDDNYPSCRYRKDLTPNCKERCAIGLLIPDDKYDVNFDGCYSASRIMEKLEIKVEGLTEMDLLRIQSIHDTCASDLNGWSGDKFIKQLNQLECFNRDNEVF